MRISGEGCQDSLHLTCPRCGAPLPTLAALAGVAVEAAQALGAMRLALPSRLTVGVRALAASLPCHAGTCAPRPAPGGGQDGDQTVATAR